MTGFRLRSAFVWTSLSMDVALWKAVEQIIPVHHAQVLTYLKLTKLRLGLLVNFNVPLIKDGLKRIIL